LNNAVTASQHISFLILSIYIPNIY